MDHVLKHVIDKRDRALREAEGWERWIKAYDEPLEPLDLLTPRTTSPQVGPADGTDIALRKKNRVDPSDCLR
jgi:hypothetical protein